MGVVLERPGCFLPLAERWPAARKGNARTPTWTTSPLKPRARTLYCTPSGRKARQCRFRSTIPPNSPACRYKPASGRGEWPNRDPLGENVLTGEIDAFTFVMNAPTDYYDYLGQQAFTVGGGINDAATGEAITGYTPTADQVRRAEVAAAVAAGCTIAGPRAMTALAGRCKPPRARKPPRKPTQRKPRKPTCTLTQRHPPNSALNKCTTCWKCVYSCSGGQGAGGFQQIVRFQIGGCIQLKGPGFVPGFLTEAMCEAAADAGQSDHPVQGVPAEEL